MFQRSKTAFACFLNKIPYSVICAASAGNDGMQEIVYPAAYQNDVMGVASTSDTDMRSSFSNYGGSIVWVAAPGEAIISTYPFSTYAAGWGTSFSAPFVSGAGALLLNLDRSTNESKAAAAVAHAAPVGTGMGNGRLDLVQALQSVSPPLGSAGDFAFSFSPNTDTINSGESATLPFRQRPAVDSITPRCLAAQVCPPAPHYPGLATIAH